MNEELKSTPMEQPSRGEPSKCNQRCRERRKSRRAENRARFNAEKKERKND